MVAASQRETRRLAREGAQLEKLAAELGQVAVAADVTRADDIARLVDEPYRRFGRLDVLFNNLGVIRLPPLLEVTAIEWDRVLNVNLRAVFFVARSFEQIRGSNEALRRDPEVRQAGRSAHRAADEV
jgi:NAD(P)-dependent dehydrogenase (short-subunit alcohol dehydrogenase family)